MLPQVERREEFRSLIRYQLSQMRDRNEHHRFEDLCRAVAAVRIAPNVLPATGPVSAGGDQGRDFETFRTASTSVWHTKIGEENWVFCCTLQRTKLKEKILGDVLSVMRAESERPECITFFSETNIAVALRHRLITQARQDHDITLQIIDGQGLSELLAADDCAWVASEFLNIPLPNYLSYGGSDPSEITIMNFSEVDPIRDLGVHPFIRDAREHDLPPYVERTVDLQVDEALGKGRFVVIEGNSASGKSRAAYEALLRNAAALEIRRIVVPRSGPALRHSVSERRLRIGDAVWLDDLERFLGTDGVDAALLTHMSSVSLIVIATMRSRARAAFSFSSDEGRLEPSSESARRVFLGAETVRLRRELDATERLRAAQAGDGRIVAALTNGSGAGLAEYLAAGPATLARWTAGVDGENDLGGAMISAAIDFRRAGYHGPIPGKWLREVAPAYSDPRTRRNKSSYNWKATVDWCTTPVEGASACLLEVDNDSFAPFDYLVDFAQARCLPDEAEWQPSALTRDIPEDIWHSIGEHIEVSDPSFISCLTMASVSDHPGLFYAFTSARTKDPTLMPLHPDPERILILARTCTFINLCIPCMMITLELDLDVLIDTVIRNLDHLMTNSIDECVPSRVEVDCLRILSSLCAEGFGEEEFPLRKAFKRLADNTLRAAADLLTSTGDPEGGKALRQLVRAAPTT